MNMSVQGVGERSGYDGEILDRCGLIKLDLRQGFAVVVSGAPWYPCGHVILNVGGRNGYYCHVAERKGYPRYMNRGGFSRYLEANGKRELRRTFVPVPNPEGALLKLEQLLAQSWTWWLAPHNCATFVEEILRAGGSSAGLYSNCPILETFR